MAAETTTSGALLSLETGSGDNGRISRFYYFLRRVPSVPIVAGAGASETRMDASGFCGGRGGVCCRGRSMKRWTGPRRKPRHLGNQKRWARALFVYATASATASLAAAQRETPVVVTLPLTPAGLQYTANVTLDGAFDEILGSDGSGSSTIFANTTWAGGLIIDTSLDILAFQVCNATSDDDADVGDADADAVEVSSEGNCIDETLLSGTSIWKCGSREVDNGRVVISPNPDTEKFRSIDRQVTLSDGSDSSLNVSFRGDVIGSFSIAGEADSTLDGWEGALGVLGLAKFPSGKCSTDAVGPSETSVFSNLLSLASAEVFALDLGDEDYNSTLEIGGYTGIPEDAGDLVWGETQTAIYPHAWGFTAFDLRACGRSLFDNVTSSWPAVLSTGSACLGLPEEMFDSLMAWVPVERPCSFDPASGNTVCYVSEENAASELPWLSFRLSEHGQEMYLPLSSLLLDEGPADGGNLGDKRLCVTMQASMKPSDIPYTFALPSNQAMVSLGTLPLRSLYAVVRAEASKVGLAQKAINASLRETGVSSCEAAVVCRGMQAFKESDNTCSDPACSVYFFSHLDEATMTCRAPAGLKALLWVLAIVFAVVEMAGHFLRAYYGGTGVALRGHRHPHGWEFRTGRMIEACIGKTAGAFGYSSPHYRAD